MIKCYIEDVVTLVERIDEKMQELNGFRYALSKYITPTMIWALNTKDSERFLNELLPYLSKVINREDFLVKEHFERPIEDLPLLINEESKASAFIATHDLYISNVIYRWRLEIGI
jgi:hypothetical protein